MKERDKIGIASDAICKNYVVCIFWLDAIQI